MLVHIEPSSPHGALAAPPSKSLAHRAVLCAALANGTSRVSQLEFSQDVQATLAEYTAKAIEMLDNPDGFFMMVEGGKIDWACHANDIAAVIHDVLALDAAIAEAVKFYEKHPDETLILVTNDHETGGLSIGYAATKYRRFPRLHP